MGTSVWFRSLSISSITGFPCVSSQAGPSQASVSTYLSSFGFQSLCAEDHGLLLDSLPEGQMGAGITGVTLLRFPIVSQAAARCHL